MLKSSLQMLVSHVLLSFRKQKPAHTQFTSEEKTLMLPSDKQFNIPFIREKTRFNRSPTFICNTVSLYDVTIS